MTASEETEYPEDEAIADIISANDSDHVDDGPKSSWAWLVVGLIAGVLALIVTKVVLSEFQAPMPAEYHVLVDGATEGEVPQEANDLEQVNRRVNHGRWLYSLGATMAIVFGWATGVINRRIVWGLIGAVAGVVLAVVMGTLLSSPLLDFEKSVLSDHQSGDLNAMLLHAIQWLIIGTPIAIAVGIGTGRFRSGLKVIGAVGLAAMVGSVVYVIGGTLLDPLATLVYAQPVEGSLSYLWHFAPLLLCGLFLSRSRL